jgi:hypothetical protein
MIDRRWLLPCVHVVRRPALRIILAASAWASCMHGCRAEQGSRRGEAGPRTKAGLGRPSRAGPSVAPPRLYRPWRRGYWSARRAAVWMDETAAWATKVAVLAQTDPRRRLWHGSSACPWIENQRRAAAWPGPEEPRPRHRTEMGGGRVAAGATRAAPTFTYFVIWIRRSIPSRVCSRPSWVSMKQAWT